MQIDFKAEKKLTAAEFWAARTRAWETVISSVYRFERQQTYQRPGNLAWEAFVEGDLHKSLGLIEQSFYEPEKARRDAAIERGAYAIRIRAVQIPLTSYLRWEFETYFAMLRLGEEIRVIEANDMTDLEEQQPLQDFFLFDEKRALIPEFDREGQVIGGWSIETPAVTQWLTSISHKLTDRSETFQSYYARLKGHADTLTQW